MDDLRAFYAERYREADRLVQSPHGVLERVRTQELLARHLPDPPAAVRAARLVETDPALIAASGHLLAVGSA